MTIVRRSSITALSMILCAMAYGQEQSSEEPDTGVIDEAVPVAEDTPTGDIGQDLATDEQEQPVTEEAATDAQEQPVTEEDVLRAHAQFKALLDEQNYDAADVAAKRVVELSIRYYGPRSEETAKALINLAVVQNANRQYDAAVQNFTSSIEIIETLEDRLNAQLVNPLRGLGAAQLGNGRPDLARDAYERATHITHVNEGPHNIEQVEILQSLAEAYVRLGDAEAARDVLDRIDFLNVRHFTDDPLGLIPSLMSRAAWQHRSGYYNDERATYRRTIRIIEDVAGNDDARLLDPLIKLGQSYYYFEPLTGNSPQYVSPTSGETYLKRAVRIAESAADLPWIELAAARLALADYYIYAESYSRAKNLYEEVWNDLSVDDDRLAMRGELFGQPRPIWLEALPPYTKGAAGATPGNGEVQTGRVTISYEVSSRGRARVDEAGVIPSEFSDMERMVEREIKRRVYRPVIVDGDTTDSGPLVFTHEFRYGTSELEEMRNNNNSEQTAANQ